MIQYDSKLFKLTLSRTTNVDGEAVSLNKVHIDMSLLPEHVRQVAISAMKLAIAYANGNDLLKARSYPGKEKDTVITRPPLVQEFQTLLNKVKVEPKVTKSSEPTDVSYVETPKGAPQQNIAAAVPPVHTGVKSTVSVAGIYIDPEL